ncbi:MAG: DEAD/DEAH box helicase family protein [Bacillota bacterium]|nr:DEAD/DEAH box helicase family protein [Bacillota bacterium]
MAYVVDRVVVCDAFREPDKHYLILPGGKSRLVEGRRPSKRFLASAKEVKGGLAGILAKQANLFEDNLEAIQEENTFVNALRDELRVWRQGGYQGVAEVSKHLLRWWFDRDEERHRERKRFFFCQQEAVEAVIYLYEVKRHRFAATGDLVRYALKLATGTGKTVVMALLIVWSTLHKAKVAGSSLSNNFLVLVPNLTVLSRVRGVDRETGQSLGPGLDPANEENLYDLFDMVHPDYRNEFRPSVQVRNWQSIPLVASREDWIGEDVVAEGRFLPASIIWQMQRRRRQDPGAVVRRALGNWRDVVIINDEAHHAYGEKQTRKDEEPGFIRWNKIIDRLKEGVRVPLVVDLSATPWYGSGSPKPDGTLFEWVVTDFSVYDSFESGLVKVVRLPDPGEKQETYLDLWDQVKDAKTKEEYLSACKGAIASAYSSWAKAYSEWASSMERLLYDVPAPVLLVVTSDATRAAWVFEHLSRDYELLRNPDDEDRRKWVTIQVDSKIFDADKGNEAVLREMVNTVGKKGKLGEHVRAIVSVNMLSEGWDVKSVTHIVGLRAFGSPLLTEQVVGRGLRRTSYEVLYKPLDDRMRDKDNSDEETVDALGIPFIGFPVERRRHPKAGDWSHKPFWIGPAEDKERFAIRVPNVRSWAVGYTVPLAKALDVDTLPELVITPKETPARITLRPVVGGSAEAVMTLDEFRREYPVLRSEFILARELYELTNPGEALELGIGPTFEELLEVVSEFVDRRVRAEGASRLQDIGIYYWTRRALDILETALKGVPVGHQPVPILGDPEFLDTRALKRFQWTGVLADGKKCHTNKVPCHTDLERQFADFLDGAGDVLAYLKNERFGFSVTYYENNRPRQYYPDFIVQAEDDRGQSVWWLAETKGEIHPNTAVKRQAAESWCERVSRTQYGPWHYLFVPQIPFQKAVQAGVRTFAELVDALGAAGATLRMTGGRSA